MATRKKTTSTAKKAKKELTQEEKDYQIALSNVPEPYRTIGDLLMKYKSHKDISKAMNESIHRTKHLIKTMKKMKHLNSLQIFKDVL